MRARPLLLALTGVLARSLYGAGMRALLRESVRRVNAGDPRLLFATYARDVTFVFPGDSSWAGEYRGREEVKGFVRRFIDVGLALEPTDILIDGPPWTTRVCLRFVDRARAQDGTLVYENDGVILIRSKWGRVRHYENHEDTQKVAEFDRWLEAQRPAT